MIVQKPLHFVTQNAALAEALARVGFKLAAVRNVYTDAKLESLRMPNAMAAKAKGLPGHVSYYFEQRHDLGRALKAWDEAGIALDKKEPFTVQIDAVDAIPIIRAVMRGNQEFRDLWKTVDAQYLRMEGEAETEIAPDGGKTVTLPGFKVISEKATPEEQAQIFPQ